MNSAAMSKSPSRTQDRSDEMSAYTRAAHEQPADALVVFGATGDLA
jgi:hypothetical protein